MSYRKEKYFLGFSFDTDKPGERNQQKEDVAPGVAVCHAAHTLSVVIIADGFQNPAYSCRNTMLPWKKTLQCVEQKESMKLYMEKWKEDYQKVAFQLLISSKIWRKVNL